MRRQRDDSETTVRRQQEYDSNTCIMAVKGSTSIQRARVLPRVVETCRLQCIQQQGRLHQCLLMLICPLPIVLYVVSSVADGQPHRHPGNYQATISSSGGPSCHGGLERGRLRKDLPVVFALQLLGFKLVLIIIMNVYFHCFLFSVIINRFTSVVAGWMMLATSKSARLSP